MDYLDKFRKKPVPRKQQAVKVAVPKADVEINVKIVDKRKDLELTRNDLLKAIIPLKDDKDKGKQKKKVRSTSSKTRRNT